MVTKVLTALYVAVYLLLVGAAISIFASVASGADDKKDDRDRRAKAAVAVALSMPGKGSPATVATAPQPRPAAPKDYATGHKDATAEQLPLVVYVSCDGPRVDGAITCATKADTFGDVKGPAVVVGYPLGNRVMIDSTLACPAKPSDLKRAVENAARKIELPPAKAMPAPAPLNTQINADVKPDCICGDGCKCKPDSCPGTCPVQAVQPSQGCGPNGCRVTQATNGFTVVPTPKAPALPDGYRWVLTAQGYGLVDPWGEWNNQPCASNTDRLNSGYYYTPIPGRDPSPRGYWVSPCVKDSDCKVVACDVPAIGQHGLPTVANAQAVATARDTFHPNDYVGGYRRVLKPGCEGGNCPLPASPAPANPAPVAAVEPARVIVGYTQQKVCNGNGTCRLVMVPVYR